MSSPEKDFFISYASADREWAEWIAWCLEKAGYRVIIQAWDFPAGSNLVYEMDNALKQARQVVVVLSPAYLASEFASSEWADAFRRDPQGKERLLLPVRVQSCEVRGLLGSIVYCDLVDCDEQTARERLLAGVRGIQAHPTSVPFPSAFQNSLDPPHFPGGFPSLWNIPYPRNTIFTGREQLLQELADAFTAGQDPSLSQAQAISGLGGIGKTQIAVEYAYQHRNDYKAILWTLADTRESLASGYVTIAKLLNLPQKSEQDQEIIIQAVLLWLQTHGSWLLILDNADDLATVSEFIPPSFGGHILLTTRAQSMGRQAKRIGVETMDQDMGALFLLRRVGLLTEHASLNVASSSDLAIAREICQELGGLPLALDQAGAYIEETQCGLSQYLERYRDQRTVMLQHRGGVVSDHPEPVTTTWSLSFQKVEQQYPAATNLLRLCAFLHPDAIPEEMIVEDTVSLAFLHGQKKERKSSVLFSPKVQDRFVLDDAIRALSAYSLVRRNISDKTISIHRLVQAVLRDTMDEKRRRRWAACAVQAVNNAFLKVSFMTREQCERYLSHALMCALWIKQEKLHVPEAVGVLRQAGWYLIEHARYRDAESLVIQMIRVSAHLWGANHPSTAIGFNNLAVLYERWGKYEQAEPLFQRALSIRKRRLRSSHPDTATSFNNLASLYVSQGKYEQAELLFQRALSIRKRRLGSDHPDTATSLTDLAGLYARQGKYEHAEPLCLRACIIYEQRLGPDHPHTATSLSNLAILYEWQGRYKDAESLYLRALSIRERQWGTDHPDTAGSLNNLAGFYVSRERYEEAESLLLRALAIREQHLGSDHPHTASSLNSLANLYKRQKKYKEAESLYQGALSIREQQLGPQHPSTARTLHNLASLYERRGMHGAAELLYQRAFSIQEQQLGLQHPSTARTLHNLASLYERRGMHGAAELLYQRTLSIREQQLGPNHPDTISNLNDLVILYRVQGRYDEADLLYQRVQAALKRPLRPARPDAVGKSNIGASTPARTDKYEMAQSLLQPVPNPSRASIATVCKNVCKKAALVWKFLRSGKSRRSFGVADFVLPQGDWTSILLGGTDRKLIGASPRDEDFTSYEGSHSLNEISPPILASRESQRDFHHPHSLARSSGILPFQSRGQLPWPEPASWFGSANREPWGGDFHRPNPVARSSAMFTAQSRGQLSWPAWFGSANRGPWGGDFHRPNPVSRSSAAPPPPLSQGQSAPPSWLSLSPEPIPQAVRDVKEMIWHSAPSQYVQALSIQEQPLKWEHPSTVTVLRKLGNLYLEHGKYTEVEELYQLALAIYKQQLGPGHHHTVTMLHELGRLYQKQRKYEQAADLYRQTFEIKVQQSGNGYSPTATTLHAWAFLSQRLDKNLEAEALYILALNIRKQQLGQMHPDVATTLHELARLYQKQEKYTEAEESYQLALEIYKQQLGQEHSFTATTLQALASLYQQQEKYTEAEELYQQALKIKEQQLGGEHPDTAACLHNLATLYESMGEYLKAEPFSKRALLICERALGKMHPDTQIVRDWHLSLLKKLEHDGEVVDELEGQGQEQPN